MSAADTRPTAPAYPTTLDLLHESEAQLERGDDAGVIRHAMIRRRVHAAALLCLLGEPHAALRLLFPYDAAPRMMPDLRRLLALYVWRIETGSESLP